MVRMFQLYAISYQPYAKFARLASEIFLSSLQSEFFSNLLGHKSRMSLSLSLRELSIKLDLVSL